MHENPIDLVAFGQRLERMRQTRALTREALVEATGLDADRLQALERGPWDITPAPSEPELARLAEALELPVQTLEDWLTVDPGEAAKQKAAETEGDEPAAP